MISPLGLSDAPAVADAPGDLRSTLARQLFRWHLGSEIQSAGLELKADVSDVDCPGAEGTAVIDGLGVIGRIQQHQGAVTFATARKCTTNLGVKSARLIGGDGLRVRECPAAVDTTVRGKETLLETVARPILIRHAGTGLRVCALNPLTSGGSIRDCGSGSLIPEPTVRDHIRKMKIYPHSRTSVALETLNPQIRDSFVREAEVAKGIPRERLELVGVFRNIPTASISKIRFLDQRGVVLYTLVPTDDHSRIRVHDVAAVRDIEKEEIHLVAHRTRYRTAFLK